MIGDDVIYEPMYKNFPEEVMEASEIDLYLNAILHYLTWETDLGEDAHPNSVRFTLTTGDKTLEMSGASVGGGMIQITRLQGRSVQIRAELDTLILIADDRPGTINAVSGWLAAHQINIAFLRLKRDQRGGKAMMVIETDQNIPEALTRDLASLPWVHWVYQIPRLKE